MTFISIEDLLIFIKMGLRLNVALTNTCRRYRMLLQLPVITFFMRMIMDAYTGFAYVYDAFMEDMPYEKWADKMKCVLDENGIKAGAQIVELGCGTGLFTACIAKRGYFVTGIDVSNDMLKVAKDNMKNVGNTQFLEQDMRTFEVDKPVDAVVSVCDSMNYLLEIKDLESTFKSVYENLSLGGIFVFDMKKESFFRDELGCETFADTRQDCAYIWENYYDEESMINEYDLTLFIRNDDGTYERHEEIHSQRAYHNEDVVKLLEECGFSEVKNFEWDFDEENLERTYFIAKKQ